MKCPFSPKTLVFSRDLVPLLKPTLTHPRNLANLIELYRTILHRIGLYLIPYHLSPPPPLCFQEALFFKKDGYLKA